MKMRKYECRGGRESAVSQSQIIFLAKECHIVRNKPFQYLPWPYLTPEDQPFVMSQRVQWLEQLVQNWFS